MNMKWECYVFQVEVHNNIYHNIFAVSVSWEIFHTKIWSNKLVEKWEKDRQIHGAKTFLVVMPM